MKRRIAQHIETTVLAIAVWGAAQAEARADTSEQGGDVWIDVAYFNGSGTMDGFVADGVMLTTLVGARIETDSNIEVETMLGISQAFLGSLETPIGDLAMQDSVRVANPYLGLSYVHADGRFRMTAGVGVTAPLAPEDDGLAKASFYGTLGTRGMWDFWLWPERLLSVVVPTRLRWTHRHLRLELQSAAALLVPFDEQRSQVGLAVQTAPSIDLRIYRQFYVGSRLAFVWLPGTRGDNTQMALEPRTEFRAGHGFVSLYMTINLDSPLGFAFDEHGLWGLHTRAGLTF